MCITTTGTPYSLATDFIRSSKRSPLMSFMMFAPFLIAFSATFALYESIEITASGNAFLISFIMGAVR